jgi:hypothetical protein
MREGDEDIYLLELSRLWRREALPDFDIVFRWRGKVSLISRVVYYIGETNF